MNDESRKMRSTAHRSRPSHSGWRTFRSTAWALAGLIAIVLTIQFATLHKGMPYGIANRFFVAAVLAWDFATAVRLRTVLLSRC